MTIRKAPFGRMAIPGEAPTLIGGNMAKRSVGGCCSRWTRGAAAGMCRTYGAGRGHAPWIQDPELNWLTFDAPPALRREGGHRQKELGEFLFFFGRLCRTLRGSGQAMNVRSLKRKREPSAPLPDAP